MAEVKWYGQRVFAEINSSVDKVINAAALDVRSEVQTSMRGPKSGRTYRVPGTKKTYTASAPGEAPAIPTGTLRSSIQVEFIALNHRRVGSNSDHALPMEIGTRRMKARPYLRPALDKVAVNYRSKAKL